jgi:hypothetical protein
MKPGYFMDNIVTGGLTLLAMLVILATPWLTDLKCTPLSCPACGCRRLGRYCARCGKRC